MARPLLIICIQAGAQRIMPPLVHLPGQQFRAPPWGWYSGHSP